MHGWDLAVATGQDSEADPELAEAVLAGRAAGRSRPSRAAGHVPFAAVVESAPGAGPTERLANWSGRPRPHRSVLDSRNGRVVVGRALGRGARSRHGDTPPSAIRGVGERAVATPIELFFDLVFVFALTQVTDLMAEDPTVEHVVRGVLISP